MAGAARRSLFAAAVVGLLGAARAERTEDLGLAAVRRHTGGPNEEAPRGTVPPPSACEEWCQGDLSISGKDEHCGGDKVHLCGACPYCKSYVPGQQAAGALGVVSMNLMAWCTQGICNGKRMQNIAEAVRSYSPALLGTQAYGGSGAQDARYEDVQKSLEGPRLKHRGRGTYYDPEKLEPVGIQKAAAISGSGRFVSGQVYRIKGAGAGRHEFAFFNLAWDDEHEEEQENRTAGFMSKMAGGRPMILTGDFNLWDDAEELDDVKQDLNLKQVSAPGDTWCTGGAVDFILATNSTWSASGAFNDGTDCETRCEYWHCERGRSDHMLLSVGLTPL
mmetsp:Transcript_75091/g.232219  ORF Transcript_75091/g.232219 Transcript_75091/m.232219 type:complete len:333 (+) Transcript_75091:128-1126(+)